MLLMWRGGLGGHLFDVRLDRFHGLVAFALGGCQLALEVGDTLFSEVGGVSECGEGAGIVNSFLGFRIHRTVFSLELSSTAHNTAGTWPVVSWHGGKQFIAHYHAMKLKTKSFNIVSLLMYLIAFEVFLYQVSYLKFAQ